MLRLGFLPRVSSLSACKIVRKMLSNGITSLHMHCISPSQKLPSISVFLLPLTSSDYSVHWRWFYLWWHNVLQLTSVHSPVHFLCQLEFKGHWRQLQYIKSFILSSKSCMQGSVQTRHLFIWVDVNNNLHGMNVSEKIYSSFGLISTWIEHKHWVHLTWVQIPGQKITDQVTSFLWAYLFLYV